MSNARSTELRRRATVLVRMSLADKALAVLAWPLIGAASALLIVLPFRRIAWLLGTSIGPVGYVPLANARERSRALRLRHAIGRAATVSPFRADCLPQAITAAVMARAIGVPLAVHFGVQLEDGTMRAHAWSSAGPVAVSGGNSFGLFTIVNCFVIPPR